MVMRHSTPPALGRRIGGYLSIVTSIFVALVFLVLIFEQLGSEPQLLRIAMIAGAALAIAGIGLLTMTRQDWSYRTAERSIPGAFSSIGLTVSVIGATGLAGLTGSFFFLGFDALPYALGIMAGLLVSAVLIQPYVRKDGALSLASFAGRRFESRTLKLVAGIAISVVLMFMLAGELKLGVAIAAGRLGVDPRLVAGAFFVMLAMTVVTGGSRSVAWTGAASGILALLAIVVPVTLVSLVLTNLPLPQLSYGVIAQELVTLEASNGLKSLSDPALLPVVVPAGPASLTKPYFDLFAAQSSIAMTLVVLAIAAGFAAHPLIAQRSSTAASVLTVRRTMAWSAFIAALILLTLPAIAVFARTIVMTALPGQTLDQVPAWLDSFAATGWWTYDTQASRLSIAGIGIGRDSVILMLPMVAGLPEAFVDLALVGLLAATLTAASAQVHALSATLGEDVLLAWRDEWSAENLRLVLLRGLSLTVAGLGCWMALSVRADPFALYLWGLAILGPSLLAPIVMSVWWKRIECLGRAPVDHDGLRPDGRHTASRPVRRSRRVGSGNGSCRRGLVAADCGGGRRLGQPRDAGAREADARRRPRHARSGRRDLARARIAAPAGQSQAAGLIRERFFGYLLAQVNGALPCATLQTACTPPSSPFAPAACRSATGTRSISRSAAIRSGKPVIVVHGGPGGGSYPAMRRFHDPARYRIVLFDQRGCGRSTPNASLEANTTWHLVADMERIRTHLGIERWQVFGGSWGSTLSLAYAQTHPERVTELVLRGIFMLRRAELLWFYQDGASWMFPETFAALQGAHPGGRAGRHDRGLLPPPHGPETAHVQVAAARLWSMWEGSALSLLPDPDRVRHVRRRRLCAWPSPASSATTSSTRASSSSDDQLLRGRPQIRHIPGVIVHGRYDMCTPVKNAFDLSEVWPEAELRHRAGRRPRPDRARRRRRPHPRDGSIRKRGGLSLTRTSAASTTTCAGSSSCRSSTIDLKRLSTRSTKLMALSTSASLGSLKLTTGPSAGPSCLGWRRDPGPQLAHSPPPDDLSRPVALVHRLAARDSSKTPPSSTQRATVPVNVSSLSAPPSIGVMVYRGECEPPRPPAAGRSERGEQHEERNPDHGGISIFVGFSRSLDPDQPQRERILRILIRSFHNNIPSKND